MGGADVAAGIAILNRASIPTFPYPDTARAGLQLHVAVQRTTCRASTRRLAARGQPARGDEPHRAPCQLIDDVRQKGRTILTEFESKQIFAAYGIPTVETRLAPRRTTPCARPTRSATRSCSSSTPRPSRTRPTSRACSSTSSDEAAVRDAYETIRAAVTERHGAEHFQGVTVQPMVKLDGYELIIGSSLDPQFGPVLLFGTGGTLVEVFKDRALGLPPLNTTLARRMMEQTKIFEALEGVRGRKPVDLEALERLLVRFSQLVVEQRWIKEIDINPLLASPERIIALDARVVLHDPDIAEEDLPQSAIRPYPTHLTRPVHDPDRRRGDSSARSAPKTSR